MGHPRGGVHKGGRPSKGTRRSRTLRLPAELDQQIESAAYAAGFEAVNDYLSVLITQALEAGLAPKPLDRLPLTA